MRRLLVLVLSLGMLALGGCGGGNDGAGGLVGSLTVTGTQSSTATSSDVSFTIKYTNPYKTDMVGVPINYVITANGALVDDVATNFTTSGEMTVTYNVPKDSVDQSIRCVAQTGNIIASATQTVTAYGTMAITPLSATFGNTIGAQLTYTVSGGLPPYTFEVTQAPADIVTFVTGTSSITLTRALSVDGSVAIVAHDSDGNSVNADALMLAFP